MGGAAIHLLLCFILAPKYGLIGIAYASVVQNSIVLLSSWIVLRMRAKLLPVFPFKWDKGLFKEIIGYGVNFQIISVASMLYDPTTKVLLSKFGGLSLVGFYEMASRMIQQIRALVVSANHVLVPAIADLQEKTPEKIKDLYLTSYQLLFYVSVPVFALLIISAPAISELWIGSYERFFVVAVIWLSIGWALNTLAAPAYFSNLGIGVLRWNVIAHLAIGVLNAVLGLLLGLLYNGMGVIIGWVVALALGSATIYLSYHIKHDIPFIELCPRASRMIVVTCATSILFARAASYMPDSFNTLMINGAITSLFTIIIFVLLWIHPMRKRMGDWIISDLLGRKRRNQWNQPDIQG
jgi:O-antigen/teichoic acid export membrane protein